MKTDNVLKLHERKPVAELVSYLEGLLERARTGEMRWVIGVLEDADSYETCFKGDLPENHVLLGYAEQLKLHIYHHRVIPATSVVE